MNVQYLPIDKCTSKDVRIENHAIGRAFDVHVQSARWSGKGEGVLKTGKTTCLIRMLLSSGQSVEGPRGYFATAAARRYASLGQILFLPPDTELRLEHHAAERRALVCEIDLSRFGPLVGFAWSWQARASEDMLDVHSDCIRDALLRLTHELFAPGFASELFTETLLTGIALELQRKFFQEADLDCPAHGRLDARQLQRVRECLEARLHEELTLRELAEACRLTVRRFSSAFRDTMGVSLRQYVAEARICRARHLLAASALMVKQVAAESGFQSPAAFSAAFHKAVGMTPEAFRAVHSHRARRGLA